MVTTHFMDEAERCHRLAFISGGKLMAVDSPDNLKQRSIRGCMVELDLPKGIQRIEEIEELPYVKECTIHGSLLHVLLVNQESLPKLQNVLRCKAQIITPSLEDVFVALAKQQRAGSENYL